MAVAAKSATKAVMKRMMIAVPEVVFDVEIQFGEAVVFLAASGWSGLLFIHLLSRSFG